MRNPLTLSAALLIAALACGARADIADPIPEKIAKADITIDLRLVAEGLTTPVWGTHAGDGSGRLFIVDQVGVVRIHKNGKLQAKPFLDVRDRLVKLRKGFDERGLLGLAFAPGFDRADSPGFGRLYTYSSEAAAPKSDFPLAEGIKVDHQSVVAEWRVSSDDPNRVLPDSRREVLRFDQPQFNHNGGAIVFGPDGLLYIAVGDGGAAMDTGDGHGPHGNGQNIENPLATILRIDPLGRAGAAKPHGRYSVPADNPLVGKRGLDEIYAYGLRNPWRMAFDQPTGRLVVADVGQAKIEEILIVQKGGNYGWPIMEGTFYFHRTGEKIGQISADPPAGDRLPKMLPPVAQYDHDEGISITGGFVYRGKAIPALKGLYVFGEWKQANKEKKKATGRLFVADLETGKIQELRIGKEDRPLGALLAAFGEDENGELYVMTQAKAGPSGALGKVWKIEGAR